VITNSSEPFQLCRTSYYSLVGQSLSLKDCWVQEEAGMYGHRLDSVPLRCKATPEEVAYPVLFLAIEYVNMITGHVLRVDGGWTIK
jgi:2-deoxy-D-gluconate 3-dehydrogenase